MDLGEFWETRTGAPIPLGGIVMKKELPESLASKLNALIRRSLEYAFDQYPNLPDFVRDHAQEMEETVMRKHVDLYVNNYSLTLGEEGRNAVRTLLEIYDRINGGVSAV
jgi:1,4-dihydroxy-6-naphthoate synthase